MSYFDDIQSHPDFYQLSYDERRKALALALDEDAKQRPDFAELDPKRWAESRDKFVDQQIAQMRQERRDYNNENDGDFKGGVKQGLHQLAGSVAGSVGILGDAVGLDSVRDWGFDKYQSQMSEAELDAPRVGRLEDIDGFGDAVDWLQGTVGTQVPMVIGMAGSGAITGLAAKKILQTASERAIGNMVSRGVAKEVAEKAVKKKIGDLGQKIGITLSGGALEGGGMWGEDAATRGVENANAGSAAGLGVVSGFTETLSPVQRIAGGMGGIGKGILGKAVGNAAGEGAQEVSQGYIADVNKLINDPNVTAADMISRDTMMARLNEFAAGAVIGGGMSVFDREGLQNKNGDAPKAKAGDFAPPQDGPPVTVVGDPLQEEADKLVTSGAVKNVDELASTLGVSRNRANSLAEGAVQNTGGKVFADIDKAASEVLDKDAEARAAAKISKIASAQSIDELVVAGADAVAPDAARDAVVENVKNQVESLKNEIAPAVDEASPLKRSNRKQIEDEYGYAVAEAIGQLPESMTLEEAISVAPVVAEERRAWGVTDKQYSLLGEIRRVGGTYTPQAGKNKLHLDRLQKLGLIRDVDGKLEAVPFGGKPFTSAAEAQTGATSPPTNEVQGGAPPVENVAASSMPEELQGLPWGAHKLSPNALSISNPSQEFWNWYNSVGQSEAANKGITVRKNSSGEWYAKFTPNDNEVPAQSGLSLGNEPPPQQVLPTGKAGVTENSTGVLSEGRQGIPANGMEKEDLLPPSVKAPSAPVADLTAEEADTLAYVNRYPTKATQPNAKNKPIYDSLADKGLISREGEVYRAKVLSNSTKDDKGDAERGGARNTGTPSGNRVQPQRRDIGGEGDADVAEASSTSEEGVANAKVQQPQGSDAAPTPQASQGASGRDGSGSGLVGSDGTDANRKPEGRVHDYSNTQVKVSGKAAQKITDFGKSIPDSELYIDEKDPSYGRETEPHVTVRYGLGTDNPKDIEALSQLPPFKAKLGKVSIFENDKYDVVKTEIESGALRAANKRVGELVDLPGETFKDYQPHATIAYVKKGEGKKYVGNTSLAGEEIEIDAIDLTDRNGKTHTIKLKGGQESNQRDSSPAPVVKEQPSASSVGGSKIAKRFDYQDANGNGIASPAAVELRKKSFSKQKKENDVLLGSSDNFVSFEDALQYTVEAIEAGVRPQPFQIANSLDIAPGYANIVLNHYLASEQKPPTTPATDRTQDNGRELIAPTARRDDGIEGLSAGDVIKFTRGGREYSEVVLKVMPDGSYMVDSFGTKYIKPSEVVDAKQRERGSDILAYETRGKESFEYRVALGPKEERPAEHLRYRIEMRRRGEGEWVTAMMGWFPNKKDGAQRFVNKYRGGAEITPISDELEKLLDAEKKAKAAADKVIAEEKKAKQNEESEIAKRKSALAEALENHKVKFKRGTFPRMNGEETTGPVFKELGIAKTEKREASEPFIIIHIPSGFSLGGGNTLADAKRIVSGYDLMGLAGEKDAEVWKENAAKLSSMMMAIRDGSAPSQDVIDAIPPAELIASGSRKTIPEYAKRAGIKTAVQAKKKGVTNFIYEAKEIADSIVKSVATRIATSPESVSEKLAEDLVRQVSMQGGREIAMRSLANQYDSKAKNADFNVQGQYEAIAQAIRKYKKSRNEVKNSEKAVDTAPKSISEIKEKYNGKVDTVLISERDNGDIHVASIIVGKENRGSGVGSALMKDIVAYADSTGRRIVLSPGQKDDRHGTTSRGRLVKFYKRFGFVENKGRNKDFQISEGMYRTPSVKNSESTPPRAPADIRAELTTAPNEVATASNVVVDYNATTEDLRKQGWKEDNANAEAAQELEDAINGTGKSVTITAWRLPDTLAKRDRKGRNNAGRVPKSAYEFAERISSIFGKEIVWITADGLSINGVTIPSNANLANKIFIDVRALHPAHVVYGHELLHHIKENSPKEYADLLKIVEPLIVGIDDYRDVRKLDGFTDEQITEEIVADLLGDSFNDPSFWQDVAGQSPGKFRKIAAKVREWLNRLINKLTLRGFGSEQHVTDLKTTRDALSQLIVKTTSAKGREELGKNAGKYMASRSGEVMRSVRDKFRAVDVESEAFKEWFKGSVVTVDGKVGSAPLKVYHGTTYGNIEKFLPNGGGEGWDKTLEWYNNAVKNDLKLGYMNFRSGSFFSPKPEYAGNYTGEDRGAMYPVYVSAKNPVYIDSANKKVWGAEGRTKNSIDAMILVDGEGGINEIAVIDPTIIKSAISNTGVYSRTDPRIHYSIAQEVDAATADPKVVERAPNKPDISLLQKILASPEYYFREFPAAWKMYQRELTRHKEKYELEQSILGDFVTFMKGAMKATKEAYKKANDYILDVDRTGKGFRLKHDTVYVATLDGEEAARAETVRDLDATIDNLSRKSGRDKREYKTSEGDEWTVVKPDGKLGERYTDEKQAVKGMLDGEADQMREEGFGGNEIAIVMRFRAMTNNAFDEMIADLRQIIKDTRARGLPEPEIDLSDEERRFLVKRNGRTIAHFRTEADAAAAVKIRKAADFKAKTKGKERGLYEVVEQTDEEIIRKVKLSELIAQMGDMRGTYMPRQRNSGAVILRAEKGGKKIMEKFDFYMIGKRYYDKDGVEYKRPIIEGAKKAFNKATGSLPMIESLEKRKRQLESEGYKITISRDTSMPESVFEAGKLIASVDALLQESSKRAKGEELDKEVAEEVNRIIAANVAQIVKERGFLSSRIARSNEYWEGFETDLLQAGTQYAKGLSSGIAKRNAARDMFNIVLGRDIPWHQWKADNPEGTWGEYDEEVKTKRIDPAEQKNLHREVMDFLEYVLRNEEQMDRVIGTLRGLAVVKFLGFRVSSAAVNATNLLMAVPATISAQAGKGGIGRALLAVKNAATIYGRYRSGFGNVSDEDRQIFLDISARGWDQAQFNHENAEVLMSKVGKHYSKFAEMSMYMFGAVEKANRATTIFAAYKELRRNTSLNREEALQRAKEISDDAHGTYVKGTTPAWARGNVLRMTYTFQKFMHNYLLNMAEMGAKGDYKELAYMLLSPVMFGGIGSTLVTPVAVAVAKMMGFGDDPEEELYSWAEKTFGSDAAFRHGLPGFIGVNLKGSIDMNIPMPRTTAELLGAPGALFTDAVKGAQHIGSGEFMKAGERLLPTAFGSAIKAVREGTEGVSTGSYSPVFYGDEPLKADGYDQFLRFWSFNPSTLSGIREKQWHEKEVKAKYDAARSKINAKIKRYYIYRKGDYAELMREIADYNERVVGSGREDITKITRNSIKSMVRSALRPNKTERSRN